MFSSVEEEQRPQIIERCYWPLLHLARKHRLPIGIEAPACTLEFIEAIDASWISELRELIECGFCELIGSGYAQLIGPLVPVAVNRANLRLGMQAYQAILGVKPRIALVNEQAYSGGLVPLYQEAGYEALIMEWNNPARSNSDWDPEWCYHPQKALGADGESLSLIWNKSIAFQKFQRYVHNELDLEELLAYIRGHISTEPRCFSLYGNDAEIFDFRPGRFMTEAPLQRGEWDRIEVLIEALAANQSFSWISPSSVLQHIDSPHAGHVLRLESPDQPIPVKKQAKYNVLRWALTGRDDFTINRRCHRLHQILINSPHSTDADWQELCFLWSSDFRTHITPTRWNNFQERLERFEALWLAHEVLPIPVTVEAADHIPTWTRDGRWLCVETNLLRIRFNCRRGLAIDSYIDCRAGQKPIFGTLHHGLFRDIDWGSDYYSGHLVYQAPGNHQITDLIPVEPEISLNGTCLKVSAVIDTLVGPIIKTWTVDSISSELKLHLQLTWPDAELGILRIHPITLFPSAFKYNSLHFAATNGGSQAEHFSLSSYPINHGSPVSFLVSAQHALGLTDGLLQVRDASKVLQLEFNPATSPFLGQITHQPVDNTWFTRISLSASEFDDTTKKKSFTLSTSIAYNLIHLG